MPQSQPHCAVCSTPMLACPWGGFDCPQCDKGHHDGPDYLPPFAFMEDQA